jgi:hypothetical protein
MLKFKKFIALLEDGEDDRGAGSNHRGKLAEAGVHHVVKQYVDLRQGRAVRGVRFGHDEAIHHIHRYGKALTVGGSKRSEHHETIQNAAKKIGNPETNRALWDAHMAGKRIINHINYAHGEIIEPAIHTGVDTSGGAAAAATGVQRKTGEGRNNADLLFKIRSHETGKEEHVNVRLGQQKGRVRKQKGGKTRYQGYSLKYYNKAKPTTKAQEVTDNTLHAAFMAHYNGLPAETQASPAGKKQRKHIDAYEKTMNAGKSGRTPESLHAQLTPAHHQTLKRVFDPGHEGFDGHRHLDSGAEDKQLPAKYITDGKKSTMLNKGATRIIRKVATAVDNKGKPGADTFARKVMANAGIHDPKEQDTHMTRMHDMHHKVFDAENQSQVSNLTDAAHPAVAGALKLGAYRFMRRLLNVPSTRSVAGVQASTMNAKIERVGKHAGDLNQPKVSVTNPARNFDSFTREVQRRGIPEHEAFKVERNPETNSLNIKGPGAKEGDPDETHARIAGSVSGGKTKSFTITASKRMMGWKQVGHDPSEKKKEPV